MNKMKSHKPAKTFTGHFPLTGLLRCPMCGCSMIRHRSKDIRYYQCSTLHSKGSSVCKSNLVYADKAEEYVYKRMEQIAAQPDLLSDILDRVNSKVRDVKRPLQEQLNYINGQIVEKQKNIAKFISMI